jgi:DNA-binding CsgD family transcriptional regulator
VAFAAATTLEAAAAAAEQGRIRHDMGSVAAATELAASVAAVLREHAMPARTAPGTSPETRLWYDTALAHAARVQGHARAEAWARIADGWWAVGERYLAAKARWWEAAAALRQREQRPRGREALREAWELALELPARPLLGALAELARMARVRLPGQEEPAVVALLRDGGDERAPVAVGPGSSEQGSRGAVSVMADPRSTAPSAAGAPANGSVGDRFAGRLLPAPAATVVRDPFNLSPREYEVLAIIAEGRTNREIAERLFISERTVGVHVRNILGKLGVAGRVEAASVAIRLGLVAGLPAPSGR